MTDLGRNEDLDRLARRLAAATVQGKSGEAAALRSLLDQSIRGQNDPIVWSPGAPTDSASLPHRPGIYVISSTSGAGHYVGLALDLHHRFHNLDYGHLGPTNRSRSRTIVEAGTFVTEVRHVFDPPVDAEADDDMRIELARLEILTYVDLRLAGAHVLNSIAMLGRTGESKGSPVILCDYSNDEYIYCDSLISAGRLAESTALPAVVHGYQRTAVGFAARWATEAEVDELADSCDARGVAQGHAVADAVGRESNQAAWTGVGRNAGFRWRTGALSGEDLEHLRRYGRARYQRDLPRSRFNGVSWESRSQVWQCRAKQGFGPKDLWQTRRADWSSDLDAAMFRERKVRAEAWERFNLGRYASNATEINRALGKAVFEPW